MNAGTLKDKLKIIYQFVRDIQFLKIESTPNGKQQYGITISI